MACKARGRNAKFTRSCEVPMHRRALDRKLSFSRLEKVSRAHIGWAAIRCSTYVLHKSNNFSR